MYLGIAFARRVCVCVYVYVCVCVWVREREGYITADCTARQKSS